MLRPCSSEIDDGLSLARQYGGRDYNSAMLINEIVDGALTSGI